LGAGTGRIIRQLLTESAVLATMACALGLAAAWAGVRALATVSTGYLPFQKNISVDLLVLGFTLAITLVTSLLFGLAPALTAAHVDLFASLKEGGRAGEGVRGSRLRAALVVSEIALALLLAIGATLTARSLMRMQAVNPGFQPEGVFRATITLPAERYGDAAKRVNFYRALVERVQALPGVTGAGLASQLPFSNSKSGGDVVIEGAAPRKPGDQMIAFLRTVDPGYFSAVGARLVRGRFFTPEDPAGGPIAIINETMARRAWPNQDPLGRRFSYGRNGSLMTVVGVVADLRQTSLADEPDLETYMPHTQIANATMALVARTAGDPRALTAGVRAATRSLDKDLPLSNAGALADDVAHSTRSRRFSVALLGAFALIALLLAAVGIYGVMSYWVARRTHEIGVRMALGAEQGRIAGVIVGKALVLGVAGVMIGTGGALGVTRLLRSMLFGISATDPAVFAASSLFLLAVAAAAAYIPARRAAHVDPCVALREE